MPKTEFVFTIKSKPHTGWEDLRVTRSIERMSGQFEITVSHLSPKWTEFPLGEPVTLELDGQTLLTGWIDALHPVYDDGRSSLKIIGRDAVGDLLDCAAAIKDFDFKGQKIEQAISKILKPYGIPLSVDVNDTGAVFRKLAVNPSETVFDFIERACRMRALLPVSDGIGGLVLTKPGAARSKGRLTYGDNILGGRGQIDWSQRFSQYVVKGHNEAFPGLSQEEVSKPEGRADDPAITRYRPKVILAESQGYDLSLQERAQWQRNFNQARSRRVSYKVQGFYSDGKSLWKPNEIVPVYDPLMKIKRDMLIVSTAFEKNEAGTFTILDLALPESFDLPAEKEPKDDDF